MWGDKSFRIFRELKIEWKFRLVYYKFVEVLNVVHVYCLLAQAFRYWGSRRNLVAKTWNVAFAINNGAGFYTAIVVWIKFLGNMQVSSVLFIRVTICIIEIYHSALRIHLKVWHMSFPLLPPFQLNQVVRRSVLHLTQLINIVSLIVRLQLGRVLKFTRL
jgi:hypothetical protein